MIAASGPSIVGSAQGRSPYGPARTCAVLGSPIAHSLSPALHRAAYDALGLEHWTYERHELAADDLVGFVVGLTPQWRGLSLTMPLKSAVLSLGAVDELAALVGAGNTLVFDDDGPKVYNTDVGGLVSAVSSAGASGVESVTILGAGATARSSLVSAARLGASRVTLLARTPAKAERLRPLADALGMTLDVAGWDTDLAPTDLLVSTVTAGAADDRADECAAVAAVVFDAIYDPWPTPLAQAAESAGRTVLNGLDLLVGQAVEQVRLMTGRDVDAAVLLSAGRAALRTRGDA